MEAIEKKQIPKKIHMLWIGDKPLPWYTEYYILFAKNNNPNFEFKLWRDEELKQFDNNYTRAAKLHKKYAFATDYYRIRILYEEGGVYLDTDMLSVVSMDSYLKNQVVIGFEYKKLISTGFAATVPKHPFFKRLIDIYALFEHVDPNKIKFIINNELWTGILINQFDLKSNNKLQILPSDIKIYPSSYFAALVITPETIFLHDHKVTWTSSFKAKLALPLLHFTVNHEDRLDVILSLIQKYIMWRNKRVLNKLRKEQKK